MKLETRLYNLIKEKGYLDYGAMCSFVNSIPMKVSTGERKLRDLEADGKEINKVNKEVIKHGKIVNVWAKGEKNKPYICGYKLPSDYVEPVKQTYQIVNGPNGPVVIQS